MRNRRLWLLLLGALLALGAGGAYFWKRGHSRDITDVLEFASLYVACPLALSMLALFAYFQSGPRRP
jgi:peptidoglycan/LPS O-acetylase OafA/YrhL